MINSETKIFGSFSQKPGNVGCRTFNTAFQYLGIDAIYKSFYVDCIEKAVDAARVLNFGGFAVSMPFKREVVNYVDELSSEVRKIGTANTVVNNEGKLIAYNTDYLAASELLSENQHNSVTILGNGGYAAAVCYAAQQCNMLYKTITRENWNDIGDLSQSLVYNCTPIEGLQHKLNKTNDFIDCITATATGHRLAIIQASYQFKLYTGRNFPPHVT